MTKIENNTVDQQLCQVCETDNANDTLLVEGVSECYYRVATRQDIELAAGMRVMDGRNTTAERLKKAIEDGTCLIYSFGLGREWSFEVCLHSLI